MVSRLFKLVCDLYHFILKMVRTRTITRTTLKLARHSTPEPTIGFAKWGGLVARDPWRRSIRCTGQALDQARDRVVTPLPINEVVREGDEKEDEKFLRRKNHLCINKVVTYFCELSEGIIWSRQTTPLFSKQTPQV